ncbi:MAG: nuclear transport factor 2 family protein [Acidobacteriota bacterium]
MRKLAWLVVVCCSSLASGDELGDTADIVMPDGIGPEIKATPRFVFDLGGFEVAPESYRSTSPGIASLSKQVVARAIEGKEAWIAADVTYSAPCPMDDCSKRREPDTYGHITILFDAGKPVAWHHAYAVQGAPRSAPAAIPDHVDAGAAEVVKKLRATIGDPKAFARTVSQRNDVVLFGSEPGERTVGGNQVRAQLARWNLGFKVRDGVQAGVTSSKKVAWVAANLDARKPGDKRATAYRALFVYEKHDDTGWDVVQLQFSTVR